MWDTELDDIPASVYREMVEIATLFPNELFELDGIAELSDGDRALLEIAAQSMCELTPAYLREIAVLGGYSRTPEAVSRDWEYVKLTLRILRDSGGPDAANHMYRSLMTIGMMMRYTVGLLIPQIEALKRAQERQIANLKRPDERHAEAQSIAIDYAESLWRSDKDIQRFRVGEVTARVRTYLTASGLKDVTPKGNPALRAWFAHTIPDYAKKPGRPSSKRK